ncbi:MAG: endolytic transglycosylase MltG [Peptococcaceae bacterium]|nr:endolytic transglycosylase MltG [Peptococcaceae bacterium]
MRIEQLFKDIYTKLRVDKSYRTRAFVIGALLVLALPGIWAYNLYQAVGDGPNVLIAIPVGSTGVSIGRQLQSEGIIKSAEAFAIFVRIKGLGSKLKAGTYDFAPSMSVTDILNKLTTGAVVNLNIRVTIPEGLTLSGTGLVFEKRGLFTKDAFLAAANNVELPYGYLKAIPATVGNRIEGYLFPDTYEFAPDVTPEQVIRIMAARFNNLMPARYEQSAVKERYSLHQVVTMASIVEKEAVKQDERARIAGVFYSRLHIGMQLESCATVQYLLGTPRKLYLVDLEIQSPYNTYRNPGLPPGPVANAGLASFEAALNPEDTDFLFFYAKSDGSHIFSKTYEQHLQAIQSQQGR